MNPKMASIPDHLLGATPTHPHERVAIARRLNRWLENARFRPSFLELEAERARRRAAGDATVGPA